MAEIADSENPYAPPGLAPAPSTAPRDGAIRIDGPYNSEDLRKAGLLAWREPLGAWGIAECVLALAVMAIMYFRFHPYWAAPILAIYWTLDRLRPKSDLQHVMFDQMEHMELDAHFFAVTTPQGSTRMSWSCVCGWSESRETILLFISPERFYVLPRRLFHHGQDWLRTRAIVEANVGPRYTLNLRRHHRRAPPRRKAVRRGPAVHWAARVEQG